MKYDRIDHGDDNVRFDVSRDGTVEYFAERERILVNGQPRRGHWLLYKITALGPVIVDRDQYSNDLLERIETGKYEPLVRFKLALNRREFNERSSTVIADAEFNFGGEWVGEYYDWDGQAVFTRKV